MQARFNKFGQIEIEGECYPHDVVIERGIVGKRKKSPSKAYRGEYGHTPLSAEEPLPWGGDCLYIGTGMYGSLPIMPAVYKEAEKQGVRLVVDKTAMICQLLNESATKEVNAVLHVTC